MLVSVFFFFNDTATTEIYTLSLHDALPISQHRRRDGHREKADPGRATRGDLVIGTQPAVDHCRCKQDRKSTRLNSSHANISYAVFCLKKKKIHLLQYPVSPLLIKQTLV